VMHLAAESHVDRSIDGPSAFIETNVVGTFTMLDAALEYWRGLDAADASAFRFMHISTDEVFGTLGGEGFFREDTALRAQLAIFRLEAGSDHLARAWRETYGLPTIVTNCSNNYGPYQIPGEAYSSYYLTRSTASRCRFTGGGRTFATGFTSTITRRRSCWSPAPGKSANATTSAGATRSATSTSST